MLPSHPLERLLDYTKYVKRYSARQVIILGFLANNSITTADMKLNKFELNRCYTVQIYQEKEKQENLSQNKGCDIHRQQEIFVK